MTHSGGSNIDRARAQAEEVVGCDDCTLREALLADAIGHLCDEFALFSGRVSKIAANLERFRQAVASHDRENPTHTSYGIGLSYFDADRLGFGDGEELWVEAEAQFTKAVGVDA